MTDPAAQGGDERPPPVPDADPVDPLAVSEVPPPAMPPPPAYEPGGPLEPTPAYEPSEPLDPAPAYEPSEPLDPAPAHDSLAAEAPLTEPLAQPPTGPAAEPLAGSLTGEPLEPAPATLTPDADYALAPDPTDAGLLAQVKAFAVDKPAVFLGAALAAGWLVGKILSSSGGHDHEDDD